jgi:hypothetical protein
MGLDAKTYWLTDRQSQCGFDYDFDYNAVETSDKEIPSPTVSLKERIGPKKTS